jgi:outer membrane protein assembly factor BamB
MLPLNRRSFLATSLSATILAGSGCLGSSSGSESYTSYGYGSHNRGWDSGVSGPAGEPTEAWQFEDALHIQTPVVTDGQIFTATSRDEDSVVVALDTETGDEQWEYDAGNRLGPGFRPVVDDGTVYFVDRGGTVHAVNTEDGSRNWRRELPHKQGPYNSPILLDDAIVFGLGHHQLFEYHGLYALETEDGSTRWHKEPGDDEPWTPPYPAGENETIYAGSLAGNGVSAVSTADGSETWTEPIDSDAQYTGVAVTDDRLYCGGIHRVAVLSGQDRETLWQSQGGFVFEPPAVGDGRVLVTTGTDDGQGIIAMNESGEQQWHHATDSVFSSPSPATVVDGVVYYSATDGQIHALNAETGDEEWSFGTAENVFYRPFVVDGTVYSTSPRGLFALRTE